MDRGNRLHTPYTKGQHIVVKVEKIQSYGVFVRLDDGTRGYIRRRQLSWSTDAKPWDIVQEGQPLEVSVLQLPSDEQMIELSLTAMLPDPWEKFIREYREQDIVEGIVKNLMPFGAFIEIMPGVNGLIPLNDFAAWQVEKLKDVLWIGDDVEALITRIDRRSRKIWLSIHAYVQQQFSAAKAKTLHDPVSAVDVGLWSATSLAELEHLPPSAPDLLVNTGPVQREQHTDVGPILVIDDRIELRAPLVTWLQRRGYDADAVGTPKEAIEKTRHQSYSVFFVDIDLPEMNGLSLIRVLREQGVKANIVVMSVPEWLREHAKDIEELDVVEVFAKPLELDEVERLLTNIAQGAELPPWRDVSIDHQVTEAEPFRELVIMNHGTPLARQLQAGLQRLVEQTRAETGLIFHANSSSQTISIIAKFGSSILTEDAIYSLEESPVKDILLTKKPVLEHRISISGVVQRKYRKLLDLLSFESCIGVPIEVQGHTDHVLFLVHQDQDAFNSYRLRDALAAADLFAAVIERELVGQRIQALSKFLLSGELAAGFGHEVRNEMSGLEIQLNNLQIDCRLLERQFIGLAESAEFRSIRDAVDSLLATAGNLRATVELFQGLMLAGNNEVMDVNIILRNVDILLRPLVRLHKVRVEIAFAPDLPRTVGNGVRLQQVFLNIMLNAIQHMAMRSHGLRTLQIATFCGSGSAAPQIKVRFSDSGPGIHKQQWDDIFRLGFSTRPSGTGIGLFIARSLVESLGGKLSVERSVISVGTTFLVELPLVTPQE